jgi:MOSC domain-containing protein YiiM
MKIISINIGAPREVFHQGRAIRTGIFKEPVAARVRVRALHLEGDQQADLSVHGGPNKAVYAYPAEHYDYWRKELPGVQLPWGSFGENLTTVGLSENDLNIGDRLCVGAVELIVTEPRLPCYKLAARFSRADMVKRFLQSRRTGFYFAVACEGDIGAGDTLHYSSRDEHRLTVADVTRLYAFDKRDWSGMRWAASTPSLPAGWRDYFSARLASAAKINSRM